jgi:hypothetical protein
VGATFVLVPTTVFVVRYAEGKERENDPEELVGPLVLGTGLCVWGGVLLGRRLGPREKLGLEIETLERQKEALQVSVVPSVGPTAAAVRVRVSF